MMRATNIHFEMAERSRALNYGGIGAMHLMGQKLGLAEQIDARVQLLKRHLPYHESDHVLNLAYNSLLDGVRLRGDTDFTLSAELDRWDSQGIKFIFGMDAHPKVVKLAEALPAESWKALERLARYEIATEPRRKPHRIKEGIVRFKGYPNKKLVGETVAEFDYQPLKCGRSYRLVVVRKNISVQKGELVLFEDIKYFFYITNHTDYRAEQIVALANERCEQENVIEQLKNGVNAMRMPVDDLMSNWAYMVMSALAWNLKSWYGLLMPNRQRGLELVRMEFRRFLHAIVLLPAQIVRSGRKIIYRLMGYNSWLKDFFAAWENLRRMAPA